MAPERIKLLNNSSVFRSKRIFLFIALFVVIGTVFIFLTNAATNTQTFTGKLTKRQPVQTFAVTTGAGQLDIKLNLQGTSTMAISVADKNGAVIATKSGASPLVLSTPTLAGAYTIAISTLNPMPPKGIPFTLLATYPITDTTSPSAPTNLTAKAVSASEVDLSWTVSTDNVEVAGYDVYRNGTKITATAANIYKDTNLTASNLYNYEVKAKDAAGNVSPGATVSVSTPAPAGDTSPPSTPDGLTATAANNTQINLSWTASSDNVGVVGYDIYANGALAASNVTTATYSHSGLTANTTYSYFVKAKDAAGNASPQSTTVSATTKNLTGDTESPSRPSIVAAKATSPTQVSLSWTASTDNVGVAGYKVIRQTTGTLSNTVTLGPTATSHTDNNLTPHKEYRYSITAFDAAGNTASASNIIVFTPGSANVNINTPASGSTASGLVTVSGTASSLSGQVTKVEVAGSFGNYQLASGTNNWSAAIDTTKIPDSTSPFVDDPTHAEQVNRYIFAKVTDSTGDFKVVTLPITLKNDTEPPTARLTSPADNSAQSGFYTITGTASDNIGVKKVYLRGGASAGSVEAEGTTSWTAKITPKSDFVIDQIVVFDVNGNKSTTPFNIWSTTQTYNSAISGKVYFDANNSRSHDNGDQTLSGYYVYLYTLGGQYLGNIKTGASGDYNFSSLQNGDYRIYFSGYNGVENINQRWVPFDEKISPGLSSSSQTVTLSASATADFGYRLVNRNPDPNSPGNYLPIATATAANGLKARQYDDYITIQEILDRTNAGKLIGDETGATTVTEGFTFPGSWGAGLTQGSYQHTIQAGSTTGRCERPSAVSHVFWPYWHWPSDDDTLFHEYGHAFETYWGCLHQDPDSTEYLRVRGIDLNDTRLYTSHAWAPFEMFAEDYAQLFSAKPIIDQENKLIPRASEVPGLKDYIANTFRTAR